MGGGERGRVKAGVGVEDVGGGAKVGGVSVVGPRPESGSGLGGGGGKGVSIVL